MLFLRSSTQLSIGDVWSMNPQSVPAAAPPPRMLLFLQTKTVASRCCLPLVLSQDVSVEEETLTNLPHQCPPLPCIRVPHMPRS